MRSRRDGLAELIRTSGEHDRRCKARQRARLCRDRRRAGHRTGGQSAEIRDIVNFVNFTRRQGALAQLGER